MGRKIAKFGHETVLMHLSALKKKHIFISGEGQRVSNLGTLLYIGGSPPNSHVPPCRPLPCIVVPTVQTTPHVSGVNSSSTPGAFYAHFYNHARRLRLENYT
jgi:hypothetical protein